jgi:hypothetical protein
MQVTTNVLYCLLSNPEYVEPLRHEVETAVAEEGWTKAAMDKMHKIDSFVRESMRTHSAGICPLIRLTKPQLLILYFLFPVSFNRLVLRPFTFSNGVTVPPGTMIAAPTDPIHKDGDIYPNPEEFDGFRFAKLRERDGNAGCQATSTSAEHLQFGFGRHAWCVFFSPRPIAVIHIPLSPGRFFAINEVKAFLAHIIVTYDIKFESGKQAPPSLIISSARIPRKANAMFRKRQK